MEFSSSAEAAKLELTCLPHARDEKASDGETATNPFQLPENFQFSYTLSQLIHLEEQVAYGERRGEEFFLKISEGVEVLANHLDWKSTLVKLLLESQGEPYPPELMEDSGEEFVLRFGGIASLVAKVDFMAGLMQYLVHHLMSSEVPLPEDRDEITLVFNFDGGLAAVDLGAALQDPEGPNPELLSYLDIREITLKISSGAIKSEAELDLADFTVKRGQLEVSFQLGPNTITSTAVFTRGEGLQKEVLIIAAQLGALNFTGQAIFSSSLQEFKLEASLAGLLHFSTLLTPEGFRQPSFGFELRF
jgi:hypothetical protein